MIDQKSRILTLNVPHYGRVDIDVDLNLELSVLPCFDKMHGIGTALSLKQKGKLLLILELDDEKYNLYFYYRLLSVLVKIAKKHNIKLFLFGDCNQIEIFNNYVCCSCGDAAEEDLLELFVLNADSNFTIVSK